MFLNKQDVFQNGYGMVSLSGKIARYKIFVNVGGADMAFQNCGDERIAFGPMAKGQKKYGATSSRHKRNEQVVVYNVQKDDTLQGIAIKFGVNTEQIRRVNHLWTNDSLFLRDRLLIPVAEEGAQNQNGGNSCDVNNITTLSSPMGDDEGGFKMQPHWSHPLCDSLDEDCIVSPVTLLPSTSSNPNWCSSITSSSKDSSYANSDTLSNTSAMSNGHSPSPHLNKKSTGGVSRSVINSNSSFDNGQQMFGEIDLQSPTSPTSTSSSSRRSTIVDYSEKSAEEFLSRIDTMIATSKKQARTKEDFDDDKTPAWVTFDSDSESNTDHRSSTGTEITREGRHLRYSLRKLEKAQEELFQL